MCIVYTMLLALLAYTLATILAINVRSASWIIAEGGFDPYILGVETRSATDIAIEVDWIMMAGYTIQTKIRIFYVYNTYFLHIFILFIFVNNTYFCNHFRCKNTYLIA